MKKNSLPQRKHIVAFGESLGQIARQYYGKHADVFLTSLYEANRALVVKEPNHLRPGITLIIPEMQGTDGFINEHKSL